MWDINNMVNFLESACAFLPGTQKEPAPPGAKQTLSMLVCKDSHNFLFTVISIIVTAIIKHLFYWDACYTYRSCPAKCLAVGPWPHRTLPTAHTFHRTPKRQQWPSFTDLWSGLEDRGRSQFCCAKREGPGSRAQHVEAAERQHLLPCLGQRSQLLLKRDTGKGITLRFKEMSAFKCLLLMSRTYVCSFWATQEYPLSLSTLCLNHLCNADNEKLCKSFCICKVLWDNEMKDTGSLILPRRDLSGSPRTVPNQDSSY